MHKSLLSLAAITALATSANAAVLYSDSFNGAGGLLNTVPVQIDGLNPATAAWSANSAFRDNGTIDGSVEGSALLPFEAQPGSHYELSMDVNNTTDRWIAMGFARDPLITPGGNNLNDRLSNEAEGISWMLYRKHASDQTQDVQIFGGLRTGNAIADNNLAVNFNQTNQLKIIIDTAANGLSLTADFQINGVSLLAGGPVNIARTVDEINFVGLSFDNATADTNLRFDNFLLTGPVPEPASLGLLALGGLLAIRRR